ncbi:MAG: arginase family protein [Gemmatimonadaceae bacterium]
MTTPPPVDVQLCVVPYDSALLDTRMGAGPRHLVAGGLPERLTTRGHDVRISEIEPPDGELRAEIGIAFALNRRLSSTVAAATARGALPITLAGNCNTAVGTIAGAGAIGAGILWFDAHGDFNTPETTIGGYLDGMALAMVTGRCWAQMTARVPGFSAIPEENVILVGGGDLDPFEAEQLAESTVVHLAAADAVSRIVRCIETLSRRVARLYVHVDLDVLDASEGLVNAYSGGPGLPLADLLQCIDVAASRIPLTAAALTAYDPRFDRTGSVCTAAIAVAESMTALATHAPPRLR